MNTTHCSDDAVGWPFANGEMAQRVRTHDWAASALGPMQHRSTNLRTTMQLVLVQPNPSLPLWDPEFIQIYSDHYGAVMDAKPPVGLGRPARQCRTEGWHIKASLYEQAWQGQALQIDVGLYTTAGIDAFADARRIPAARKS